MISSNHMKITTLYGIYENNVDKRLRRLAKQRLTRWGFNADRKCVLPDVCDRLLVRTPAQHDELFPGLDFRDRLHAMWMFLHRQVVECLNDMRLSNKTKKLLDRRLTDAGLTRALRHHDTHKTYRIQRTMFSEANMSAADRVCVIFLLPHVFGHQASDLPQELRAPFLTVVSRLELILIASSRSRPYNERELHEVFERGWIELFSALEFIFEFNHNKIYNKRLEKHRENPEKNKAPKRFRKKVRYLYEFHHTTCFFISSYVS